MTVLTDPGTQTIARPAITPLDVSSQLWIGKRERQEDAVLSAFAAEMGCGFAVLSDGMGGHASGELASTLVTEEVFTTIDENFEALQRGEIPVCECLTRAIHTANDMVRDVTAIRPKLKGMGATAVALFLNEDRLTWLSVGDSPLYRVRDGEIMRLNADHSMAPEIDQMVAFGQMSAEIARHHPDRSILKSAITGQEIAMIDCPSEGLKTEPGDIYLLASDGVQTLSDAEISQLVWSQRDAPAREIALSVMEALQFADAPEQDNTSLLVIKLAGRAG